jgi:uncharacterized protein YegJ (DUF2314 family)
MFRIQLLVLFATTVVGALTVGCGPSSEKLDVVQRDGQPDFIRTDDDDLMDRARVKAQATYREFLTALEKPQEEFHSFAIKKGFETPDQSLEHIWLNQVTWDGSKFNAVVDNEPVDTRVVSMGDRVTVTPEELTDWMYLDGQKLQGGFTIRALYSKMPEAQRRELIQQTGMEVPPVDF